MQHRAGTLANRSQQHHWGSRVGITQDANGRNDGELAGYSTGTVCRHTWLARGLLLSTVYCEGKCSGYSVTSTSDRW